MTTITAGTAARLFLRPLAQERRRIALVLVALLLLSLSQAAFLLAVGPLLKGLFGNPGDVAQMRVGQFFPQFVFAWTNPAYADITVSRQFLSMLAPMLLLIGGLAKAAASYLYQYNQQTLAYIVAATFRSRIFAAIVRLPLQKFTERSPGGWMSMIMNDVHFLQVRMSDVMTSLLRDGVAIISCLTMLAFLHWPSALLLALLTPLFALMLGRVGGRISFYAESWQKALSQLAAMVLEIRTRFDFIRAQGAEDFELARFQARNGAYYKMIRRSLAVRAFFAPSIELAGFVFFAALIVALRKGYLGEIKPENLLQILAAMGLMFKPWRSIGEQYAALQETMGALRAAVSATLAVEQATESQEVTTSAFELKSEVRIERCVCGFAGKVQFEATDLSIGPGKSIAIIGPSGSGKSTFIKSIAGLYEPITWRANESWQQVASAAAFVSQEPFLFEGSLRENLVYGLSTSHAAASSAEIKSALDLVDMSIDISRLPTQLDTHYKPISSNFSGGQIQRLVIARMLLRGKSLWLFDEATSAVDASTDGRLCRSIVALAQKQRAAVMWVTHRLQHLDAFDEVWYIEQGKIIARGKHADLLQQEAYRRYVQTQEA